MLFSLLFICIFFLALCLALLALETLDAIADRMAETGRWLRMKEALDAFAWNLETAEIMVRKAARRLFFR